jgi:hypothetical protein
MIKLEHAWSRWNNCMSDKPYHNKPTQDDLQQVITKGETNDDGDKYLKIGDNPTIIISDNLVCVIKVISSGYASNKYEDIWRIKK